jgi:hypothetical protein
LPNPYTEVQNARENPGDPAWSNLKTGRRAGEGNRLNLPKPAVGSLGSLGWKSVENHETERIFTQ